VFEAACEHCVAARASRRSNSYDMLGEARLPPLVDAAGELVPATELPCACAPDAWSASAPIEVRRRSARICAGCVALASCERIQVALGDDARGVMAGLVLSTPGQRREAPTLSSTIA